MSDLLHKLLAMRFLRPNPPDPKMGGGFVPNWSSEAPQPPPPPTPSLPPQLPSQPPMPPPPDPSPVGTSGMGDIQLPSPPPMPTSATMSRNPAEAMGGGMPTGMPGIKPTIPQSMGGTPPPAPPMPPAPPSPPMSTPGSPMMGSDPMAGMQGPDNMAPPPPEPEQAPLDSTPMDPMNSGAVGALGSQMQLHFPRPDEGGGDLVSLIKRLLHKRG